MSLAIRFGPFRSKAITFFKQKFMPTFLGEFVIRDRSDANALLQRHNVTYAVGFDVLKVLS
jgi:hypothetical protein